MESLPPSKSVWNQATPLEMLPLGVEVLAVFISHCQLTIRLEPDILVCALLNATVVSVTYGQCNLPNGGATEFSQSLRWLPLSRFTVGVLKKIDLVQKN